MRQMITAAFCYGVVHESHVTALVWPTCRTKIGGIKNNQNPGWWVLRFLCIGDFDADDDIDHQQIWFLVIGDKLRLNCSAIKFALMCVNWKIILECSRYQNNLKFGHAVWRVRWQQRNVPKWKTHDMGVVTVFFSSSLRRLCRCLRTLAIKVAAFCFRRIDVLN